ncbi:MAG: hypothetical protein EOL97_13870 [Spirochaetia bacterium]|nr:hypothetical protein [Spirochaetia bacterium]
MKISIPLGQPGGHLYFDKAYISNDNDKPDMYLLIRDIPRKTLSGCIKYLKKKYPTGILLNHLDVKI